MKTLVIEPRFMSLAYDDLGSGFPVVLLHAFPFDHEMWFPQQKAITDAGFRLILPDLPEFGETSPGSEVFTIDRTADVIVDLLDDLGAERAVVGGLSMGGYITMAFARRYPDRLAGLILADTKAPPDDAEARASRDRMIADVEAGGPMAAAEVLLPKLFHADTWKRNRAVIDRARAIILRQRSAAIIAGLYALRDRPDATPELSRVQVPALVLVGEHDAVTPPAAAERIAAAIPHAELVQIPCAGHLSNLENPVEFNSAVVSFLKKTV